MYICTYVYMHMGTYVYTQMWSISFRHFHMKLMVPPVDPEISHLASPGNAQIQRSYAALCFPLSIVKC